MILEGDAKFEEKLTFDSENDMRTLAKFHKSTQKSQNWYFYWVLSFKVENLMSLKSAGELCVVTMKNGAKFEKKFTSHFKIDMRNLTNCVPST